MTNFIKFLDKYDTPIRVIYHLVLVAGFTAAGIMSVQLHELNEWYWSLPSFVVAAIQAFALGLHLGMERGWRVLERFVDNLHQAVTEAKEREAQQASE